MKKILMFAAAAAMISTSCIVDEVGKRAPDEPNTRLTVSISGVTTNTRAAIDSPVEIGNKNTLENAVIFVLDGTTDDSFVIAVESYSTIPDAGKVTYDAGTGAYSFTFAEKIKNGSYVFMVGNVPSGDLENVEKLQTLGEIKLFNSDIESWTDTDTHLKSTIVNQNNAPVAVAATTNDNNADLTANVSLTLVPVISRLELQSVVSTGIIESFKVTGVYLFNYNTRYTYSGGKTGEYKTMTVDPSKATVVDSNDFVDALAGLTKIATVDDAAIVSSKGDGTTRTAKPDAGKVWGFNVAAGTLPMLIIELSELVSSLDEDSDSPAIPSGQKRYLKMTGYKDLVNGTDLDNTGNFLPGKSYTIPAINFEAKHIDMNNTANVPATSVNVEDWGKTTPVVKVDTDKTTVTLGAPENGSITKVEVNGNDITTDIPSFPVNISLPAGWEVTLTVTPATDYKLSDWTISGTDVPTATELGINGKTHLRKITLTVPAKEKSFTITPIFESTAP